MIIKSIKLKNFKCFTDFKIELDSLTFIKGINGIGKTTLALESILFVLYSFTTKEKLSDLPTRSKANTCSIEIEITHNNKEYKIIRHYPTKLVIIENDKELQFVNSTETQEFINENFGDRLSFMKFRLIDISTKETNFLEEGQVALKKILFSGSDEFINNMRIKLNSIKHEREIFCRDKAVIYPYYPSEKRLQIITNKYKELNTQENEIISTINEFERERNSIERSVGQLEMDKKTKEKQKNKLSETKICYTCNQPISIDNQKRLLTETDKYLKEVAQQLKEKTNELSNTQEIIASHQKIRDTISIQLKKISELKLKLESRIKQKEYKYTQKDVEIVKKAIIELDKLSTYYLAESIKILEPIINSILTKINLLVSFTIDDKNRFTITLQKDDIEYKYSDLSTGQKLILQIAFKIAILLERGERGIIIADEGLSSLDYDNLLHVINLFQDLPFQLILVLHRFDDCPEHIKTIDLDKELNNRILGIN